MNNTLANGLALLGFLSHTAESFGVSELASELKLPKSHVHRLLQTLVATGYAVQDGDRRYRIGFRPLQVSCAVLHHLPLRAAALPVLHRLSKATGMDAIVSIPHDGAGLIVGAVYPEGRQRDPGAIIGSRLAVGTTATGTLFSACLPGLVSATTNVNELAAIRQSRFVVKDPQLSDSFNGMAAMVGDATSPVVGALGMSGPGDQFRKQFARTSDLLRTAADELTTSLSHLRPTA
jgi:DNA-binding IclR family transcriptional regulator